MDEIDAALDFRNVSIVANYIKVSKLGKIGIKVRDSKASAECNFEVGEM